MHTLLRCFSILLIVVVSFTAIGFGRYTTTNKMQCVTCAGLQNSSTDNVAVNNTSFDGFELVSTAFRQLSHKKSKVRFRAMYCFFELSEQVNVNNTFFDVQQKLLGSANDFLCNSFVYLFNLRGPPHSSEC